MVSDPGALRWSVAFLEGRLSRAHGRVLCLGGDSKAAFPNCAIPPGDRQRHDANGHGEHEQRGDDQGGLIGPNAQVSADDPN